MKQVKCLAPGHNGSRHHLRSCSRVHEDDDHGRGLETGTAGESSQIVPRLRAVHTGGSDSCSYEVKCEVLHKWIPPHYKEAYRLAVYALLCGGTEAYDEFLRAEQINHFLSEQEISFILEKAQFPVIEEDDGKVTVENGGVSTYFPTESDEEIPDLDLGWPDVPLEETDTSISVLFNPPRQDTPTIKEVVRKQIQEARQLIALSMDVFTDVDIFKELIVAALRGVVVYLLLDQNNFSSFLNMSQKLGVCLSEMKTIRVRTVQGLPYQCQSSMKFHGALEQKFILIDCRTVVYGNYSYTWTFEKLNLSMVLVVTGQLVSSYDEEFRRLYARSVVPPLLSREKLNPVRYLHSPASSQLALHQLHLKNKAMNGLANGNNNVLTRGVSMQDRLHHFPEMGNLVRGHSYGSDLQKFNSMTRLRMGTKDIAHGLRQNDLKNRSLQQHLRHQTRYGADHNLIPFNSETSLNKWKLDAYLNGPLDASYEALSPLASPYSSHTGLNELQSQNIHLRAKDIRQRMEEAKKKRLSLQEYANLQQSQEPLRNMYLSQERSKSKHLSRGMELRQNAADLEVFAHQSDQKIEPEHVLTDRKRAVSHNDFKSMTERKILTYDWHEAMSRSTSDLDGKSNEPAGKLGLGSKHQRHMESLTEIPEEKEGVSCVNSSDLVPQKEEQMRKDDKVVSFEEQNCVVRERKASAGKMTDDLKLKESKKSAHKEVENGPKKEALMLDVKPKDDAKTSSLQRKNSVKSKVSSMLSPDEKKPGKKDLLQRKPSLRSHKLSGSNLSLRTDSSVASTIGKQEHSPKKSQKPALSSASEEKAKLSFNRFSPQRLSKKKTDSEKGSRSALNDETAAALYEARKEKAYSKYEHLLAREDNSLTKGVYDMDKEKKEKTSSLNRRRDESYQAYGQTQNPAENKIGRFMQKMKLIGNKSK
ncbi:hypothetical protein WMY93_006459 [Mugilogobius chulae]|uniref:Scaffolding anchor of CK1 domain-containing protein n=1 Tax=Mugilogobius chulae TaxID=88201 RepID=A0AAW0PU49_9GOBI